jgi:signal transduction histidine kinase
MVDRCDMNQAGRKIFHSLHTIFDHYPDVDSLIDYLIKELVDSVYPADAGIIYLYDRKSRQLVPQVSYGYPAHGDGCNLAVGEGVPGQCFALTEPLLITSSRTLARYTGNLKPKSLDGYTRMRLGLPPTRSCIATPLSLKEKGFGVILLEHFNQKHRKFNQADSTELEVLSNWISLVIEHHRSNLELKESKRSYRELLGKFLASSEDERKRIAREIHDEINHILLSVKLNMEDMEVTLPPQMVKAREKLKVLRTHVSKAFDDLHRLSLDLRPPGLDELGLPQALDWYVQTLSKEAGLPIKIEVKGLSQRRPAPVVETELLRIAQEALSNILKHARSSSANVRLTFGRSKLTLEVADDGIGFDVDAILTAHGTTRNLGLLGMIERAEMCGGELNIRSSPGSGTKLTAMVPIGSYDWGAY